MPYNVDAATGYEKHTYVNVIDLSTCFVSAYVVHTVILNACYMLMSFM